MDKKVTYSKALPIITGLVFIGVVLYVILNPAADYYTANTHVTAITASAGCFTGVCVWYMKKAQAENAYKLQMELYKEQAGLELENLRQRLAIQREFQIGKDEIDRERIDSQLDDIVQDSFRKARNTVDNAESEAGASAELSQYI